MARITVEDCVPHVPNRFELIHLAVQRVRELNAGQVSALSIDRDKPAVVALREIAEGAVAPAHLKRSLVDSLRRVELEEAVPEATGGVADELRSVLSQPMANPNRDRDVQMPHDFEDDPAI